MSTSEERARQIGEEDAFDALTGLTSLSFPRPERLGTDPAGVEWRAAVKVIDPRGNEGLRVLEVRG